MKILIKTKVDHHYKYIFSLFNLHLFKALKPPLINLEVERFDGCKSGDEIHLKMNFQGLLNQQWVSIITSDFESENDIGFIDEGKILPPPLSKWKHIHRIQKIDEKSSYVIDDIEFTSGNAALDAVIYPALYSMFLYRKPIYKRELR
jgi:ligand-binding SRPBCC domain-containing protein